MFGGESCGPAPTRGDVDGRRTVRKRVNPSAFDGVVVASMRHIASFPELSHETDRFLEHVEALPDRRPAFTGDVLVEVFAGSDAEKEPVGQQRGGRGRR